MSEQRGVGRRAAADGGDVGVAVGRGREGQAHLLVGEDLAAHVGHEVVDHAGARVDRALLEALHGGDVLLDGGRRRAERHRDAAGVAVGHDLLRHGLGVQALLVADLVGVRPAHRVGGPVPARVAHPGAALAGRPAALEHVGPGGEDVVGALGAAVGGLLDRAERGLADQLVEVAERAAQREGDRLARRSETALSNAFCACRGLRAGGVGAGVGARAVGLARDGEHRERVGGPARDDVGGEGARDAVGDVGAGHRAAVLPRARRRAG